MKFGPKHQHSQLFPIIHLSHIILILVLDFVQLIQIILYL